jgi:hypothetical protein
MKEREKISDDLYWTLLSLSRAKDSLYTLAHGFSFRPSSVLAEDMANFYKAYICNGVIKRPEPPSLETTNMEFFDYAFHVIYDSSLRVAIKPRDYVFAIML